MQCASFLSPPPKVPGMESSYRNRNRRTTHLRTLALGVEVLATGVAEGAGLVLWLVFSSPGFIFACWKFSSMGFFLMVEKFLPGERAFTQWGLVRFLVNDVLSSVQLRQLVQRYKYSPVFPSCKVSHLGVSRVVIPQQDYLRMNVAPDQIIILSLQTFLDHRWLSSI